MQHLKDFLDANHETLQAHAASQKAVLATATRLVETNEKELLGFVHQLEQFEDDEPDPNSKALYNTYHLRLEVLRAKVESLRKLSREVRNEYDALILVWELSSSQIGNVRDNVARLRGEAADTGAAAAPPVV